jgi:hypothetical protein
MSAGATTRPRNEEGHRTRPDGKARQQKQRGAEDTLGERAGVQPPVDARLNVTTMTVEPIVSSIIAAATIT